MDFYKIFRVAKCLHPTTNRWLLRTFQYGAVYYYGKQVFQQVPSEKVAVEGG